MRVLLARAVGGRELEEEAIFLCFESWESRYVVGESWGALERGGIAERGEARRSEAAVL
jgi:hypothetical protein